MERPEVHESLRSLLDQTLETAVLGLFEQLEISAQLDDASDQATHDVACAVGFASTTLRGSLTLTTEARMLREWRPAELRHRPVSSAELMDWLGELGNQLLGRLKNRLILHGVSYELGTPSLLQASEVLHAPSSGAVVCRKSVRTVDGLLTVNVDANPAPDFELVLEGEPEVLAEGELMMF